MTREEAISGWIYPAIATMWNEKMVKEILEALEQEPCEDAVNRAEIIHELNRLGRNAFKDDTDYDNFFAFVDGLLPVTPQEPKTGHWFYTNDKVLACSECEKAVFSLWEDGKGFDFHPTPYCPWCGAKMEGVQEIETRGCTYWCEVLDGIRAEIDEQVLESLSDGGDDWFTAEKVNECLDIIDKYRGSEEE